MGICNSLPSCCKLHKYETFFQEMFLSKTLKKHKRKCFDFLPDDVTKQIKQKTNIFPGRICLGDYCPRQYLDKSFVSVVCIYRSVHPFHVFQSQLNLNKHLTCVTKKQTLRSLSLSYQKKDGRAWPRPHFFLV